MKSALDSIILIGPGFGGKESSLKFTKQTSQFMVSMRANGDSSVMTINRNQAIALMEYLKSELEDDQQ